MLIDLYRIVYDPLEGMWIMVISKAATVTRIVEKINAKANELYPLLVTVVSEKKRKEIDRMLFDIIFQEIEIAENAK
jgi:hypothetical protein